MIKKIEVTIDIIVHATEDASKFFEMFKELFDIDQNRFSVQNITGHFDNPIILLKIKISKKEALLFVEKIASKLPREEVKQITESLDERVVNSTLHLRLGKQKFVQGNISLQEKNAIKIKIFTPIYTKKAISKTYSELLNFSN